MRHRSPVKVGVLSFITFGIYYLVWSVRTKNEMNAKGAQIPTAWLLIIPVANFFWLWRFSEGVELVTNKKMPVWIAFVALLYFSIIAAAVIQDELNEVSSQTEPRLAVAVSPKSRLAVFLLAYFLGPYGAHRFYLGKYKTGALMILTLGGFFGIWALIDCTLALCGRMKDRDGRLITEWGSH